MSREDKDRSEEPPPKPPELKTPLIKLSEVKNKPLDWSSYEIQSQLPTDILLITSNDDDDFLACYSILKSTQRGNNRELGFVDFGNFADEQGQLVRVALMKCEKGLIPVLSVVKDAAEILNPKVTLFVGVCASIKPEKAKLGDVAISTKLATYDEKKIRSDGTVEYRGTKSRISKLMSRLILSAKDGWQAPLKDPNSLNVEVHCDAVMLSGSELVECLYRRQDLADYFQDALVLDMEGAGGYSQ